MPDEPILFVGIHSWWHDPEAEKGEGWHLTTSMLTMDSYGPMQDIHHRIPVFITHDLVEEWLNPKNEGTAKLFSEVSFAAKSIGNNLAEHRVKALNGDDSSLVLPL